LRTWETGAGQLGLYAQTASNSRLEGPSLDHHVQTARQLDSDDLGQVPGAEEHVFDRRIHVTQTPVPEERIIEHTEHYYGSGNDLSCRCPRGHAELSASQWILLIGRCQLPGGEGELDGWKGGVVF
jgi:hypothetical protein